MGRIKHPLLQWLSNKTIKVMPCITASYWSLKIKITHHILSQNIAPSGFLIALHQKGTITVRLVKQTSFRSHLWRNLFLLVHDGTPHSNPPPPLQPPSGYSRCRCETIDACRRQKKGAALPTEPLPLTAGLLIQTLKALALSNPCFTRLLAGRGPLMTIVVTMKDGNGKYILSNSEVGDVQTLRATLIGSKMFAFLNMQCVS